MSFFEANVDFAQLVARQNNPKDVLNRHFVTNFGSLPKYEEVLTTAASASASASASVNSNKKTKPSATALIRDARGVVVATGTGKSLREAEYDAARRALAYYGVPAGTTV